MYVRQSLKMVPNELCLLVFVPSHPLLSLTPTTWHVGS